MKRAVALLLFTALLAGAQEIERRPRKRSRMWLVSIGVLVAANLVDAHSSWGYPERNALLASSNGRFGARAIGIKTALIGGVIGAEWFASRKVRHAEPAFATTNFAVAGVLWKTAANNYRIREDVLRQAGLRR